MLFVEFADLIPDHVRQLLNDEPVVFFHRFGKQAQGTRKVANTGSAGPGVEEGGFSLGSLGSCLNGVYSFHDVHADLPARHSSLYRC
jgi:hypothetical protein